MSLESVERAKPSAESGEVFSWWHRYRQDRAAMAQLRRCRTPLDALMVPAGMDLVARFARRPGDKADRIAALAAILAHVREDTGPRPSIARAVGRDSLAKPETAKLSEGRFRRLLQSETPEEVQRALTRLVRMMDQKVNLRDLAATVLYWGDKTRRRWAFDYYGAAIAAPKEPDDRTPT